jgi:hypothetical protein
VSPVILSAEKNLRLAGRDPSLSSRLRMTWFSLLVAGTRPYLESTSTRFGDTVE